MKKLTFMKEISKGKNPTSLFKCSCSNKFIARNQDVKSGHTTSCGCYARKVRGENVQKRRNKTKTYER